MLCHPMGGLPELGFASEVRHERTVTARSSFALPQYSTGEMPDMRKGEEPATTLSRNHKTPPTTSEKRAERAKG